jgi:tetratricopeptide (TPR) repeat protein
MEVAVAARIKAMHRKVMENNKPAMWGRLGMVYQAHALDAQAFYCYGSAMAGDAEDSRWPYLAAISQRKVDPAAALAHFEIAAANLPKSAAFSVHFGDALQEYGELGRAAEQFQAALDLDPTVSHALLGLGRISLARGELGDALKHLTKAAGLAPNHGEVHALLAQIYNRRGERKKAELAQLRARAFPEPSRPRDPVIEEMEEMEEMAVNSRSFTRRGLRLAREERWAEAERAFQRVLEIRSGNVQDYANLGGTLARQGRIEDALTAYRKALEVDPLDPGAHNNLALALLKRGDSAGASEHLEKATTLDPTYAEAYYNLAGVHFQEKDVDTAIGFYRQALGLRPWFIDVHADLGDALASQGDLQSAVASWRRALEIDPRRVPTLYRLAVALVRLGEHDEAMVWLLAGLELAPNSSRFITLLAWEFASAPDERLRDGVRALELAQRLRTAYPHRPDSFDLLAAAWAEMGDFGAAERAAEQGIELARGAGQARSAAEIESRRVGYEHRRPYRQKAR